MFSSISAIAIYDQELNKVTANFVRSYYSVNIKKHRSEDKLFTVYAVCVSGHAYL
jgi:hypothetical protein